MTLTLETKIKNLNQYFPEVEADKLPEYQEVLNAIKSYNEALLKKMSTTYTDFPDLTKKL